VALKSALFRVNGIRENKTITGTDSECRIGDKMGKERRERKIEMRHKRKRREESRNPISQSLTHMACLTNPISLTSLDSKSNSKSKLLYDWQFTANHFVLASTP
jgi:hypothetical protein